MSRTTQHAAALVALAALGIVVGRAWFSPDDHASGVLHDAPADAPADALSGRRPSSHQQAAQLDAAVTVHRDLYGDHGMLSEAETQALKAARAAAAEQVKAAVAAADAQTLAELLDTWRTGATSRERLVIIEGLAGNPSADAVAGLELLYNQADLFRYKEEILRSLGNSEGPGHIDLLVDQLWNADDDRLSQIAAGMLYGEADAMSSLVQAIYSDLPMNTRLEAVHSLGGVGTDQAREALSDVAESDQVEPRVQVYAEKEIARSFG